ncbi:MAG: hypothetical protein EBY32_10265 [Proteobacteria bacterium]|nr:hypothetical protein [Pseudomonadota bacterium]
MTKANIEGFVEAQSQIQADGVREGSGCGCRRDDIVGGNARIYGIATQVEITRLANRTVIGEVDAIVGGSGCEVVYRDRLRGAREKKRVVSNGSASTPVGACSPVAASTAAT